MVKIKTFVFSPLQVNTYLVFDESGKCVIIDPACYDDKEKFILVDFIKKENLEPVLLLSTHGHIDHILGNNFVIKEYNIPFKTHKDSVFFIENAREHAQAFGFEVQDQVKPDGFIDNGDIVSFGDQQFEVIHLPGHADGSLCFYHIEQKLLFCGDVLFKGGIGRADLPTGDYNKLISNINEKLMVLPEDVRVFPGHGPETTIGYEKSNNPVIS